MTVSAISLNNLIPSQANWSGLQTKPIRVPVNLVSRVLDMVNAWVTQLQVSVGADEPETEQQWVNQILGLPDDYQQGDPLPEALAAEVNKAKNAVAIDAPIDAPDGEILTAIPASTQPADKVDQALAAIDGAIGTADRLLNTLEPGQADLSKSAPSIHRWKDEPDPGTQEWINYMQSPLRDGSPSDWQWSVYLRMVKQEARQGHASAQAELEQFRANGVQVDFEVSDKQRAKLERRAARQARQQSKQLTNN